MKSLLLRSDAVVAGTAAQIEEHPDRFIWRTPDQPYFWYGNCVIFKEFSGDAQADIARARADHPGAKHCCIQWDIPDLPERPSLADFKAQGFDTGSADCLVLHGELTRFALADGIAARQIEDEADWLQVIDLQTETGIEEGHDPIAYRPFVEARFAAHRRASEEGRAAWWGLFDGPLLVADMGIYVGDGLARYQSVETRPSHRRRGLCRALVGIAHDWAKARAPEALPIIVAETDGAPGRTYRACGFAPSETLPSAVIGSYAKA